MDDVIYKQAAIDAKQEFRNPNVVRSTEARTAYDRAYANGWNDCNSAWIDVVKDLPPAQPEVKELSEWKADFKEYINALNMPKDDYNGIMEYIDEIPPAQPEQRWILCSERLPELNSRCVLLYGNDNISGGYYRGNRTFDVDYGDEDVKTMVIAWMLLPEPYAKRSSE